MTAGRATLVVAVGALALAASSPAPGRRGEVVVRNRSFSSLEISVLVGGTERGIGSAPPEFSNTLYFPIADDAGTLSFRARLTGADEVLHESRPVEASADMKVRWTLPDNRVEPLREHDARFSRVP